jgi:hypothetical protein
MHWKRVNAFPMVGAGRTVQAANPGATDVCSRHHHLVLARILKDYLPTVRARLDHQPPTAQ